MNNDTFNDLTSGVYIISSKSNRNIGCIATSVIGLTNENKVISISLNKKNVTDLDLWNVKMLFGVSFFINLIYYLENIEIL